MAGLLYFFPGHSGMIRTAKDFPKPLPYLAGVSLECGVPAGGPGDLTGAMVATIPLVGDQPVCRYAPKGDGFVPGGQHWYAADGYWIGWEKERPPSPQELARTKTLAGDEVTLTDGQQWTIPVLHGAFLTLPTRWRRSGAEVTEEVDPQYAELCAKAVEWMDYCKAMDKPDSEAETSAARWGIVECFDYCAAVLGVNYRLGVDEVSALGLIGGVGPDGEHVAGKVMGASVGTLAMEKEVERRKKKATANDG